MMPDPKAYYTLSKLFLDTEPTEAEINTIASSLYQLKLSTDEIDNIVYYDLFPILYSNLLSVTGAWCGFDKEWLLDQINSRHAQTQTWAKTFYNYSAWLLVGWMVTSPLDKVKLRLREMSHHTLDFEVDGTQADPKPNRHSNVPICQHDA